MGSFLKITSQEAGKNIKTLEKGRVASTQKSNRFKFNFHNQNEEIINLSNNWKELANKYPELKASAFLISLENYRFAQFNPDKVLPSASTIKIPILLLALEMIDNGELLLNEQIKLEKELIGGGAGWIAYESIGSYFPIYELANEMIRISDNTATNLLINRLGGINRINKRLKEIGLKSTQINNLLPDLKGTNTTSAKDLAYSIALVDSGNFLSVKTRDLFREILSTSKSNNLLPKGFLNGLDKDYRNIDYQLLIEGYRIYNKTGDIGITYADTGLIQMPDNTRAVVGLIVKGPFNDPRSADLIREMAKAIVPVIKPQPALKL